MNGTWPVGSSDEIEVGPCWPAPVEPAGPASAAEAELIAALERYRGRGGAWPPSWDVVCTVARGLRPSAPADDA